MRGESMKDKSKKSTYSTTFGIDPKIAAKNQVLEGGLEPPCKRMHMNLNHACLPVSPLELNLYFADKIPLFTDCQVSIKHF